MKKRVWWDCHASTYKKKRQVHIIHAGRKCKSLGTTAVSQRVWWDSQGSCANCR